MWGAFSSDIGFNNQPLSYENDAESVNVKNSETIDVETRVDLEPQEAKRETLTPEVYIL